MRKVTIVMAAVAALVTAGCGDDPQRATGVDRAFAQEMVPHHRSAVAMADIALQRGRSAFVRELAADIRRTQQAEIAQLRERDAALAADGVERGDLGVAHGMMGMDDDPATLRNATPFDRAFVEMMIPHHEGAVAMSQAQLDRGRDPQLRRLAEQIIEAQRDEIREMRAFLAG
jgi:uncharacterized protein (DUF305 family)